MKKLLPILTLFLPLFGATAAVTKSVGVDNSDYLVNPTNFAERLVVAGDGITITPTNLGSGRWAAHIDSSGGSATAGNTIFVDSVNGNDNTASRGGKPFATISNAIAAVQNNTTVIIRKGLYTVPTFGFKTNAPLKLYGLTNVAIIGEGNPRIQAGGLGSVFSGGFLSNVVFTGFEVAGVRSNDVAAAGDQSGAWWFEGPSRRITWDKIGVFDMQNQGIVAIRHPDQGLSYKEMTVANSYFSNIGFTNSFAALRDDGAAIVILAEGSTIFNNTFVEGVYHVEFYTEGSGFTEFIRDFQILNNRSYGAIKYPWNFQGTNQNRIIFKDNITVCYATNRTANSVNQYALLLHNCRDCEFDNNIFSGAQYGFIVDAAGYGFENSTIRGNTFTNITANVIDLLRSVGTGNAHRNNLIVGNIFDTIGEYSMNVSLDQSLISDNMFHNAGTSGGANVCINVNTGNSTNGTNIIISGNLFTGSSTDDTIVIGAKANKTRLYNNVVVSGNAISDTGVETVGLNANGLLLNGGGQNFFNHVATTNSVQSTNRFGVIHVSYASVVAFDFNQALKYNQTNRITGIQTIVLTNSADNQTLRFKLIGEVSGGTSRVITLVPNTGQLIHQAGDTVNSLATSLTFTLTNGLSVEVSDSVDRLNGTNIHNIAIAYSKH